MKPNSFMNGGLNQTAQNAYYVDDNVPRLILSISKYSLYDGESFVLVTAVTKSSNNAVWHSDVIDPKMHSNATNATCVALDELIFSF